MMSAEESGTHFRHELLSGVVFPAEVAGEIPAKPMIGAGPVNELMEYRGPVMGLGFKVVPWGKLNLFPYTQQILFLVFRQQFHAPVV
jgi:hypothetical protein